MATSKRTSPGKKSARPRKTSNPEKRAASALRTYPRAAALAVSSVFAPLVWVQAVLAEPAANQTPSGGTVVNQPGSTTPNATYTTSGSNMQINQTADKAA